MSQLNTDPGGGGFAGSESAAAHAIGLPHPEAYQELAQELAKWRERVPRLVTALRERTEEVARLQAELAVARAAGTVTAPGASGVRARDAIIGELEGELATLREANARLQGDLHARSLSIDGLKRDLAGWKAKWQSLAEALDEANARLRPDPGHAAEVAALRQSLTELEAERDSLKTRNAQLFETTGLANRQLEALADDLADLRAQIKTLRGECADALRARDARTAERDRLADDLASARADVADLEERLQTVLAAAREGAAADGRLTERIRTLESECTAGAAALARAQDRIGLLDRQRALAEQAQRDAEAVRVSLESAGAGALATTREAEAARERAEQALADARAACGAAEDARTAALADAAAARRALAPLEARAAAQAARIEQLAYQLDERSALVRGLEQEAKQYAESLAQAEQARIEAEQAHARAEEALVRANRHGREQSDYIVQLDDRVERQKELLLGLEQELANAQESHAAALKRQDAALAEREAEIRALRLQITALQGMLEVREPQDQTPVVDGAIRADRDSRTLTVLNQQLKDARDRNASLLERLREFEERALDAAVANQDDDLTRIRGVGPRLAQHLRELGVTRYGQIAEIDPAALDDPHHALAGLKARILRDGWIQQASVLRGP